LKPSERKKLFEIADKIERNTENLNSNDINTDIRLKENDIMSKDKFYEVDLKMLREAVMNETTHMKETDLQEIMNSVYEQEEEADLAALFGSEDMGDVEEVEIDDDDVEAEVEVDVDEVEADLPDEIEDALDALEGAIAAVLGKAETGLEDLEGELEGDEEVEVDVEEEEIVSEVYEVDPKMLRRELSRMKRQIQEGKEGDSWGGKGDSKAGVGNAYGGKGPKKMGHQKSFGGGTPGKDAFVDPPNLNVLKEMRAKMRDAARKNRSMQEKLNKYRSAVQTLREQLEDLNLFNAKLLYVNKLLQNKSINESQKKSVIRALDQAQSLKEAKMLYKSLTESFTQNAKSTLSESRTRGSSSKAITSSSAKPMNEVNRWATLAGLK